MKKIENCFLERGLESKLEIEFFNGKNVKGEDDIVARDLFKISKL